MSSPQEDPIQHAREWAFARWVEALPEWLDHPAQDRLYRSLVVDPVLQQVIRDLDLRGAGPLVDLGCGDGSYLPLWRKTLDESGHGTLPIVAVDRQSALIARARAQAGPCAPVHFVEADFSEPATASLIVSQAERAQVTVSVFSLQETPDLGPPFLPFERYWSRGATCWWYLCILNSPKSSDATVFSPVPTLAMAYSANRRCLEKI